MRQIKYILINDTVSKTPSGAPVRYDASNLGHHYVINSHGMLLHPIDDSQPGAFMPKPTCGEEVLNRCSIGVKYNGTLKHETCDLKLRAQLIALLLNLRDRYPSAKILGKHEYDRYHIHVSDEMNQLRRELSDFL